MHLRVLYTHVKNYKHKYIHIIYEECIIYITYEEYDGWTDDR